MNTPKPDRRVTERRIPPAVAEFAVRENARLVEQVRVLRDAAIAMLNAIQMESHNEEIFRGKWKKGAKAWSGEFVQRMRKEAIERAIAALAATAPRESAQDAENAYAESMIRRDQRERDTGKPEHDRDTFGAPLRPGT